MKSEPRRVVLIRPVLATAWRGPARVSPSGPQAFARKGPIQQARPRCSHTLLQAIAASRGAKRGQHRKKRSESDILSLTGQINGEKKALLNY